MMQRRAVCGVTQQWFRARFVNIIHSLNHMRITTVFISVPRSANRAPDDGRREPRVPYDFFNSTDWSRSLSLRRDRIQEQPELRFNQQGRYLEGTLCE